jgi:caa(3)-type oxidase subunit IV
MSESAEHHDHSPGRYIKIWGILLVLLAVSILGPLVGIKWLTLITAFGIALVKAGMVCAYFMHLNIEKKVAWYLLTATLLLLLVFFTGVAPDVMKPSGQNWESLYHEPTEAESAVHHDKHGEEHGEASHGTESH